jgi:hypothetical protein
MKRKNKARISKYKKNKKTGGGNNFNNSNSSIESNVSSSSDTSNGSSGSSSSPVSKPPFVPVDKLTTKASGKVTEPNMFTKLTSSFSSSLKNVKDGFSNTMRRWFSSNTDKKKITGGRTRKFRN